MARCRDALGIVGDGLVAVERRLRTRCGLSARMAWAALHAELIGQIVDRFGEAAAADLCDAAGAMLACDAAGAPDLASVEPAGSC